MLEKATNSNPASNEILFTCSHCGQERAIWVSEGKVRAAAESAVVSLPALHVYADATYGVDCVFQGRLYHMPKRRSTG